MSSELPSADSDYAAPDDMALSKEVWDAVMASLAARLKALEAVSASWDELVNEGTDQALELIRNSVEPTLVSLQDALATLQTDLAAAEDMVAKINSGSITMTSIDGLATALALLAPIESPEFTGTPTAPTPGESAADTQIVNVAWAQAQLETAQAQLETLQDTISSLNTSLQDYVPSTRKVVAGTGLTGGGDLSSDVTLTASIATQTQAEAGTNTSTLMTPERVAQAIDALTPEYIEAFGSDFTVANVASDRSASVWYQNTTGYPIMLITTGYGSRSISISNDGSTVVGACWARGDSSYYDSANCIIPPGWYYKFSAVDTILEIYYDG